MADREKIPTEGQILVALVEASGQSTQPLTESPVVHDAYYHAPSTRGLVFTISAALQSLGITIDNIQSSLVVRPELSQSERMRIPFLDLARVVREELKREMLGHIGPCKLCNISIYKVECLDCGEGTIAFIGHDRKCAYYDRVHEGHRHREPDEFCHLVVHER